MVLGAKTPAAVGREGHYSICSTSVDSFQDLRARVASPPLFVCVQRHRMLFSGTTARGVIFAAPGGDSRPAGARLRRCGDRQGGGGPPSRQKASAAPWHRRRSPASHVARDGLVPQSCVTTRHLFTTSTHVRTVHRVAQKNTRGK